MSGKVGIKVATPADAEVIAEILTKAFSQFESNYTPEAARICYSAGRGNSRAVQGRSDMDRSG